MIILLFIWVVEGERRRKLVDVFVVEDFVEIFLEIYVVIGVLFYFGIVLKVG